MYDITFWLYLFNFILSTGGFIIFAWWWWKIGRTTEIYAYITLLFLSDALLFGGNVHIRILKSLDPQAALQMLDSLRWHLRTTLHAIILSLILWRMLKRILKTYKYKNGKELSHRRREYPKKENDNEL